MTDKYSYQDSPLVSIVIPTKDNPKLLKMCIASIETKSSYKNYEIIVVDNDSKNEDTKRFLKNLKYQVLPFPYPFNYSRINNFAVSHAKGEYVIFLNDDTSVISPNWIEMMLEQLEKPRVGIVGVLLVYPNDTIQHAGILIGVGGIAIHVFEGLSQNNEKYKGLVKEVRQCSAVTAACMMMRKNLFEQFEGFDENLTSSFNDIDLCLRIREKGYTVMYTPYAQLYHIGTSTRPYTDDVKEIKYFVKRWHDFILKGDPYYEQNLSRIRPYEPKTQNENLILTDTGLFTETEQRFSKRLIKYLYISNKIRKRHGISRLIIEIIIFLKKRVL